VEPALGERSELGSGVDPRGRVSPVAAKLLRLQRSAGNRTTLAFVQAQLKVGSTDDPAEREADRMADAVLASGAVNEDDPLAGRRPVVHRARRAGAPLLAGGFDVTPDVEQDINASRVGGRRLPEEVRASMEDGFGTDLGAVRIHTDERAATAASSIGATAFTHGRDVFFGAGAFRPGTDAGRHLIAHELAHVVQQDGAIQPVRRAVGFEFEDQTWTVLKLQNGKRALRDPTSWKPGHWWFGGATAAPGSEKTPEEKAEEKYKGENVFQAQSSKGHINGLVGPFDLQTGPKKGTLHQGKDYKIEPDGPYADLGATNRMDLEIVTEPFPETEAGEERLAAALADMRQAFNRYDAGATGEWDGSVGSLSVAKFVAPATHGFSTPGIYLHGGKPGGHFKPQVTGGVRLADLPHVMETLGVADATETGDEEQDNVRQLVYGNRDPAQLAETSTLKTLGTAPTRARKVISTLVEKAVITRTAKGLPELTGFLSMAIVYMTVLSVTTKEGIKVELPLMSRYPFGTLWKQVPEETRSVFASSGPARLQLFAALDPELGASVREHLTLRFSVVPVGRDNGVDAPMLYLHPALPAELRGVLGGMKRSDWLEMMLAADIDLLDPEALIGLLKESDYRGTAEKYDKSMAIFLRGHGNTKTVKKVEGEEPGSLALLENRNITNGPMDFEQVVTLAKSYLSWMRVIKEAGPLEH
jgi:hypothetical protein